MKPRVNTKDGEQIGVYRVVSPSGKCYVGMTCDSFTRRWRGHLKDLRRGVHRNEGLLRAYQKYGAEALTFEVLEAWSKPTNPDEFVALEQLILGREVHWWRALRSSGVKLYNGEPSGRGSVRHTEETKSRIRASMESKQPDVSLTCSVCGCHFKVSWGRRKLKRCDECRYVRLKPEASESKYCSVCSKLLGQGQPMFCSKFCWAQVRRKNLDEKELRRLYIDEQHSLSEIAKEMSCSHQTVKNYMVKYGIPLRRNKISPL